MSDAIAIDADNSTGPSEIKQWLAEINLYERETEKWRKQRTKIIKRYKDERSPREEKASRFNVLWSNVQTLLPTLYARNPKPDVQRRFKDADPVGRVASDILERCLTFYCDTERFGEVSRQSVLDYLLGGRGTLWVRYCAEFKPGESEDDESEDDEEITDDEDEPEELASEDIEVDFVHAEDFGHNVARTWEEVWCVWRKVYLTRDELIDRFKAGGKLPPLDYKGDQKRGDRGANAESDDAVEAKSSIYELWDKKRECAVWFHKDLPKPLDERDDPLKLEHFFPCPRPLLSNITNESIVPIPDYYEYQDQAIELDNLTSRISSIEKALKVAGVYDKSCAGLDRLLSEGTENQLIPVETWSMFAEKGGLKGAIDLLPLKDIADALTALYETRQQVKNDLYEITGISDIVRGVSEPEETATAQAIKSQFATTRISDRQRDVQRFVRETIRIMADIMCGHFQYETIKEISGVRLFTQAEKQLIKTNPALTQSIQGMTQDQIETALADPTWEEVWALIRNKPLRTFRVDIETDSIIKADEEAEKASRVEFLKAAGQFLQQAGEIGSQQPASVPLMAQMLMFGVRAFPIGKELEGAFNAFIAKMEKQAANPQQPPNPEMAKIASEEKIQTQKMQGEAQLEQMQLASKEKIALYEAQLRTQADQAANAAAEQRQAADDQRQFQLDQARIQSEAKLKLEIAHIDAAAKIEVARITAKATAGDEAEEREAGAEGMGAQKADEPMQEQPAEQPAQPQPDPRIDALHQTVSQMGQSHKQLSDQMGQLAQSHQQLHQALLDALTSEKEVVRGPDGKAIGVRSKGNRASQGHPISDASAMEREVVRGADGKAIGVRVKLQQAMQ